MKKNVSFKLAASTLVLGLTVVGCKPATGNFRPAAASAATAKSEAQAARIYEQAQATVQKGDVAGALTLAERAVELSPRDAGYRMLLGDLYLKSGRFLSAENAFTDVLSLYEGNPRATLSLALAQIAQGKSRDAIAHLDSVAGSAPADAGLAYALAGQPQRAIELLEGAARAPGANARVRQNLALAYAVAGDWQKARVTASQDLSPEEVGKRMQQWASFANPTTAYLQVATLLGTTPVQDSGQPVRLSLAQPGPQQPAYAEAQAPAPAPEPQAPVEVAEAPAPAPAEAAAEQAEVAFAYAPPEHADAFAAAPAAAEVVEVPASVPSKPAEIVSGAQLASAVTSLVKAPAPILKAVAPVASAPLRAFVPQKAAKKARSVQGRYVVQIGAYRSASQVEKAWSQAVRRYRFANAPMSTTVSIPGKGTFHRLAVSGFETPAEAARTCQTIRGNGGTCFVRANAGDAPVQWASRYNGRRA
ncbi:MAG TPA: tetratricopeptide repeat protein [Allosphingosinicella sp.]|jgi:Flp pilus assembly protein TadD